MGVHLEEAVRPLPSLDGFSRDELIDLVRILHGALVRAQADYLELSKLTNDVISVADSLAPAVSR